MSKRGELTRQAFEAWDSYRVTFDAQVEAVTGIAPDRSALTANPLSMIIFADGYLRGHDAATQHVARLEAALRWYADEANYNEWNYPPVMRDRGQRAREALTTLVKE